jgi:hypothetical protein
MRGVFGLNMAAVSVAMASASAGFEVVERPGPPPRRVGRQHHKVTAYTPKTPASDFDLQRIAAAERKRARKAARLARTLALPPGEARR